MTVKIALVANNYGESFDGIGSYAKIEAENFSNRIETTIYTAKCNTGDVAFNKIFNMGMTMQLVQVLKAFKIKKYDIILIEYPFVEWNPLILLPILFLKHKTLNCGGMMVLSLHEYERTHELRKWIIRKICRISDKVLVSNFKMLNSIEKLGCDVEIRDIPSNICVKNFNVPTKEKDRNAFVFFGLVNKAKAFNEMIEAWNKFNRNNDKKLYVLSSTKLNEFSNKCKGIEYIHNASNEKIAEVMLSSSVCILPIKPYVDNKNATFKTAIAAGCVCIGSFCNEYKKLEFVINQENYSVEAFIESFSKANILSDNDLKRKIKMAITFSEQYTSQKCIKDVENLLMRAL